MKKLLFVVVFVISINIYAQEFEMVTAREAYDYIKQAEVFDKYELIYVMGLQTPMGSMVDLLEGKSNLWVFLCKNKNTSDTLGHLLVAMKIEGIWQQFYQLDEQANYQQMPSLPNENWVNSTEIGKAIKNNKEFLNYLETYQNSIQMRQLSLIYDDNPVPGVNEQLIMWMAVAYVEDNNKAICYYNAENAKPIIYSIPPITSIIAENVLNFLYPNPASGKITLKNDIKEKSTVLIYDNNGLVVTKLEDVVPSNLILDVSKLNNGQYTVVILSNEKMTSQKIIIFK